MRARDITTWLWVVATAFILPSALLVPDIDTQLLLKRAALITYLRCRGKKGFVTVDKWEAWLASPRGGNPPIASPDAFLTRISQSLTDLFDKIDRTYPLYTDPSRFNLDNNGPIDIATLNLRIREDIDAIREAEEGPDESEVTETEADEFGPDNLGDTGLAASPLVGNVMADDQEGPLDTMPTLRDFQPPVNIDKFRVFDIQLYKIYDTEVELKNDIWGKRTGLLQRIAAFASLLEANSTIQEDVALDDNFSLSLWIFNGNIMSRDGSQVVVQYNTDARDDLSMAFYILMEAFAFIDRSLFRWMVRLEESLSYPDRIGIISGHIKQLQDFAWAYKENCEELYDLIDEGLNLPENWR
ncbi:hypothetical protein ABW21_db0204027 [Orbilia brochopaga]|nr:hypothetical protein ABW21_db0204027 [Drechslerella brochopaga]